MFLVDFEMINLKMQEYSNINVIFFLSNKRSNFHKQLSRHFQIVQRFLLNTETKPSQKSVGRFEIVQRFFGNAETKFLTKIVEHFEIVQTLRNALRCKMFAVSDNFNHYKHFLDTKLSLWRNSHIFGAKFLDVLLNFQKFLPLFKLIMYRPCQVLKFVYFISILESIEIEKSCFWLVQILGCSIQ
eukprot:TRINITY_DN4274_c1_g1_i3.p1 TRINITY_DN4274_c1_g1~~TRINITY_DN4274_c1_g1_i3.p1  ORF type:complete len:185 (+),score=-1.70 TRINITY_DN4274_c1_g1_i3:773-1327(+)